MKKLCFLFLLLCSIGVGSISYTLATCNQSFNRSVDYGSSYVFRDSFNNNNSYPLYICDADWSSSLGGMSFGRTSDIKNAKGRVGANSSMALLISSSYKITTTSSFNISYTITYSKTSSCATKWSHTECVNYTVNPPANPPVDGKCGSANGTTVSSKPTTNLCSAGTNTRSDQTASDGTYNWTCVGSNGGTDAYCSANKSVPATNGSCGTANGTTVSSKPTTNLCSAGTASSVDGSGPRTWSCVGANGGTTASCSASKTPTPINGSCGSTSAAYTKPSASCYAGTASSVTGNGPWTRTCAGSNGGTTATCTVQKKTNGSCGTANGTTVSSKPTTNLCFVGTASSVSGSGPRTWSCYGTNGGDTVNCSANKSATPVNGSCGSAHNTTVGSAPTSNLCSAGTASALSGNGPWTRTCAGSNGGTTASCKANKSATPVNGSCGSAHNTTVSSAPTSNLCSAGTASVLSGSGPWTWTCAGSNGGTMATCKANKYTPSTNECDQEFYGTLRYNFKYIFNDTFNGTSIPVYLWNARVESKEQYDYNQSPSFPSFSWTSDIKNQNYIVNPGQSIKVLEAQSDYSIIAHPPVRSYDNLLVKYILTYSYDAAGADKKQHSECKHYEISRCGDGVLDTDYGEVCDPNDPNKTGRGNGGCDKDCKPITTQPPYCGDGIRNNGELCDPNDPSHDGRGKDGCSADCKPINNPYCGDGHLDPGEECDEGTNNGKPGSSCSIDCKKIVECEAITPACGDANGKPTVTAPTSNLCRNGTKPTVTESNGFFTWTCVGQNKDCTTTSETCSAPKISVETLDCSLSLTPNMVCLGTGATLHWNINGTFTNSPSITVTPALSGFPHSVTIPNGTKTVTPTATGSYAFSMTVSNASASKTCTTNLTIRDCTTPSTGSLHIEKSLISPAQVTATGQEVKWKIVVTATGAAVQDFEIRDTLPKELSYSGYTVAVPTGVVITALTPITTSGETLITRKATGTLLPGEKIEITLISTVMIMPNPSAKNVVCVRDDQGNNGTGKLTEIDCDDAIITGGDPDIRLRKRFADGSTGAADGSLKVYKIGDTVSYRIDFGNSGNTAATIVSLKDFVPQNLTGVQSTMYLTPTSTHTGTLSGGVYIDMYDNITLPAGMSGYFLLTGKITAEYQDSRTNLACIYLNDKSVECDSVMYELEKRPHLKIDKTVDRSEVRIGDTVIFTLKVTNDGEGAISGFTLTDTLPNGVSFISQNSNGFTFSTAGRQLIWARYAETLSPNQSLTVTFTARVDTIGTHTNRVCLTHPDFPTWKPDSNSSENCDPADVVVKEEVYCRVPYVNPSVYYVGNYGSVNVSIECRSSGGPADIQINCGDDNGRISPIKRDTIYTYTCPYTLGSASSRTYYPSCIVNGRTTTREGVRCETAVTLQQSPSLGYCGDGQATDWEDCDCYDRSLNCSLDMANRSGRANNYNGARCINCKIDGVNSPVEPVKCFNVNNGSISINQGEMLPFYWNIERLENHDNTRGNHIEVDLNRYPYRNALANYRSLQGQSCTTVGDIALNAMVCNFKVYNGSELQSRGNYVYDIELPCFTQQTDIQADRSRSSLISSFLDRNHNNFIKDGNSNGGDTFRSYNITNDRNYAFRSSVFVIDSFGNTSTNGNLVDNGEYKIRSSTINMYGEYKLSLDEVRYLQCKNSQGNTYPRWEAPEYPYPRVCEVNFSVTKPYLLQKTPSGTVKATNQDLSKFRMYADGTQTFNKDVSSILTTTPADYTDTTAVQNAFANFVNKYSKLAVPVNSSLFGSTKVKKVPGKDIYFVEGDLRIDGFRYTYDQSKTRIKETHGSNAIYDKPFTIVQILGNTTIKGNLNHNMMLLTNGTITFDASKNCNDAQVVKGVFYAKDGFNTIGVQKNTNTKNPERCIGQNLHIKGIAIGKGLNGVMNNRRSELNEWFWSPGTTRGDSMRRRNLIMNGAALLIEYSPSLFTKATMPPGAEEFTTALEVYRK